MPVLALAAGLAACGQDGAVPAERGDSTRTPPLSEGRGGKVIDLANVLDLEVEQAIGRRLQAGARPVMVIFVDQDAGESLERFGWAVGGGRRNGPTLILVDSKSRQVRIEGDLSVEIKAAVVRQMQQALRAGDYEGAVSAGLDQMGRLAP